MERNDKERNKPDTTDDGEKVSVVGIELRRKGESREMMVE